MPARLRPAWPAAANSALPARRHYVDQFLACRQLQRGLRLSRIESTHADADELCACYANREQVASLLSVLDDMASYGELDRFTPGAAFPPLCTIWGLENRVLSPDAGRQLNARLRPKRTAWLAECGHLPMVEQPDAVADTIRKFLSEVAA